MKKEEIKFYMECQECAAYLEINANSKTKGRGIYLTVADYTGKILISCEECGNEIVLNKG